ncbi:MAG: DUF3189 family protein [Bacillota bacterium]
MIFIYNCYAGTHSSSIASAIHLNKLPENRIPTKEEILNTEYFNKLTPKDMGKIIYRGTDEDGNKIFTVGRGSSKVVLPCMKNLITLFHNEYGLSQKVILSNMSPTVPFLMSVGGFVSRRIGIDPIGIPLLITGVRQSYMRVVEIVNKTKEAARDLREHVLVLENNT